MIFKKIKQYIKEKKHPYYMIDNKKYKKFSVGEYTYGKPKIYADPHTFSIGKFCSIASDVKIYTGAEHRTEWLTTYNFEKFKITKNIIKSKGNVNIGHDVWIGDGALILSGVNIGHGAVIAARAVVVKNVQPYEIVGGNPAKHIKFRFNNEQREKLLKIQWWDWDIEKIEKNFDTILNDNIDNFIKKHYKDTI